MGWWRFTRLALEALTKAPADAAECDRAMEQLARESRLGAAVHRVSWLVRTSWDGSRARSAAVALGGHLAPMRIRGWFVVVVGATALAMNAMKPTPIGPLSWVLPAAVIAAGLVMMVMAAPLTRAIADRNS